jgi:hypothetical protein
MVRIPALQAQYDAALAAADDFVLVGTLGSQLQALQQESAQLSLSEEDYLTLAARHAALVQRVMEECRELAKAQDYTALGSLSAKLQELKALDLAGIPRTSNEQDADGANDPVVQEDDGANDPVVISSSQDGL